MPETTNSSGMESAERRKGPLILAVIQNDIDLDMFGKVFLVDDDGTTIPFPSLHIFERYFRYEKNATEMEANGSPQLFINKELRFKEREAQKIMGSMGTQNFTKVLECQRMIFLVNSPGGHEITSDVLKRLAANVKRNGGTVEGFIGNNAESAAANLLAAMDERTSLKNSTFMWHAGQTPGHERTSKETEKDVTEMQEFFDQNIRRNADLIRGKLKTAIDDDSNYDKEVTFGGAELEQAGILSVVPNVEDLKLAVTECYPELTQVSGEARRRLNLFFNTNKLEEAVRQKFGVSIILHADKGLNVEWPKNLTDSERAKIAQFLISLMKGKIQP